MRMGRYSYIGYGSTVYGANIGRFCSIASGVKIGLGSHPVDMVSTSPLFYSQFNAFREDWVGDQAVEFDYKEVVIGHDVWIGANAIVMSGVKIGHGAVIAAGAVVTKDVLPYSIVGGVPARLIRNRFSAETIKAIEATNWWRKDCDELKNLLPFFKNVSAFVQHEYYPKYSNED
jgi:acetyltransferase-like isoleucine patch superfamily enzyme